jgi:hypothetical protein
MECSNNKEGKETLGPIGCPETSVNNDHTTPRNIPEEHRSHKNRGGSLKSRHFLLLCMAARSSFRLHDTE